jgi:hypothetical protein
MACAVRLAHFLAFGSALVALGCTHDYSAFSYQNAGSGGASTDAAGGNGGTAGFDASGGTSATGGFAATGGSSGSGGVAGSGATGGAAGSGGCLASQKLCNGTCVADGDPRYGCGTNGCTPCSIPNANTTCSGGACTLQSCRGGYGDCDNNPSNGCEQQLNTNQDCGDCGRVCDMTNAVSATCTGGACHDVCDPGYGDCSQPTNGPDNGCETDLKSSNTHCGSCANDCTVLGGSGGFVCLQGACACTSDAQCETAAGGTCDTSTGVCSCNGEAGAPCQPGEACRRYHGTDECSCHGGAACAAGQTCCDAGGCVDLQTDANNCGACGNACPNGQTCTAGQCG